MDEDKYKDINIGTGAVKMSGHHKKEPILRSFGSPEEMAKHAEETYQVGQQRMNKTEMDAGFDVRDRASVIAFDIGYVIRGGGIILKEIPKDIIPVEGELTLISLASETKKYWVIQCGPLVTDLKKGDIVHIKADAGWIKRTLRRIEFWEGEGYGVAGIFITDEEYKNRLNHSDGGPFYMSDKVTLTQKE